MASWNLCTDRQIRTTCCCACWSSMKCEFADCISRSKRLYLSVPELQLWVLLSPRSTCIGNAWSVIAWCWNWTLARCRCCFVISRFDFRWAGTCLKQMIWGFSWIHTYCWICRKRLRWGGLCSALLIHWSNLEWEVLVTVTQAFTTSRLYCNML